MSPIKFCHVLLTHSWTPINKSLPKAFLDTKTPWERSWNTHAKRSRAQAASKKIQKYRSFLLESSPEVSRNFKNFNLKYREHSKQNHPNYLPRSQRSLESSSKASRNFKKLHTGEALWIQASKAPKNFRHKPSNMKNIRKEIIQIIFLDLKVLWNQAQMPPESSTNHKTTKLYGFKPLKHWRTSTMNLWRWRMHQEHEEHTKNPKNKKILTIS